MTIKTSFENPRKREMKVSMYDIDHSAFLDEEEEDAILKIVNKRLREFWRDAIEGMGIWVEPDGELRICLNQDTNIDMSSHQFTNLLLKSLEKGWEANHIEETQRFLGSVIRKLEKAKGKL